MQRVMIRDVVTVMEKCKAEEAVELCPQCPHSPQ